MYSANPGTPIGDSTTTSIVNIMNITERMDRTVKSSVSTAGAFVVISRAAIYELTYKGWWPEHGDDDMMRRADQNKRHANNSRDRGTSEPFSSFRAGLRHVLPERCQFGRSVHSSASAWNPDHVLSPDSDHGRDPLCGLPQA